VQQQAQQALAAISCLEEANILGVAGNEINSQ
jgi:hypothetical protein